jgi:hypothetical protein
VAGAGRLSMPLDVFHDQKDMETADYWVGWLSSALERVILELRAGA